MRFRPEQHLRRQSDFRAVREHGRRLNCGAFTLWCLARPAEAVPSVSSAAVRRVGVVASTAAVGHAVLRNRAKRRLRDVFRRFQDRVPVGCDVLLTARAAAVEVPMTELETRFLDACGKLSAGGGV